MMSILDLHWRAGTPLPSGQRQALIAGAQALKRAALAGGCAPLLRGRNLGLLCEQDDCAEALLFRRAATDLGAHVAHIRPSASGLAQAADVAHIARMLGRLYDAIECERLPAELVERIRGHAGVPVYDGIGNPEHPANTLVALLDNEPEDRRYLLQALLLGTIG